MIVKLLVGFLVVLAVILLYAASKPALFQVQRSITIRAAPDKIFVLVNDFHNWRRWAPQDREDSSMQRTYSGAASGEGAASEWRGSGNTGSGRMVITKSESPTYISVAVDFVKPFAAHNVNEFNLAPEGDTTKVTWTMQGPNLYIMKLMSVFSNMDRMMGKHFESGLANLKAVAETPGTEPRG